MSKTLNLFPNNLGISKVQREQLNEHPAFTIWLTGLSGSGKTTLANGIDKWCYENNLHSYVIDGDNTRSGINHDLDFSASGRTENLRRVAHICQLFNDAGIIAIASFISPSADDRLLAKGIIGEENFSEIYLDASIETCMVRDKKGLYKLAAEGKIKDFTGVNSPYDIPAKPDLAINSNTSSISDCIEHATTWIRHYKLGNVTHS